MDRKPFMPKAYLKEGCPFSFKYLLFMAEAARSDRGYPLQPGKCRIRRHQGQAGGCNERASDVSDRRGRTRPLSVRFRSVDRALRANEQRCPKRSSGTIFLQGRHIPAVAGTACEGRARWPITT